MKKLKNPGFGFITILFVAGIVLLHTHFGITGPENNKSDQIVNSEKHVHDESESSVYDTEEHDHTVDKNNEQDHMDHEENAIQFNSDQMKEFGIIIASAGPGKLHMDVNFPGEVVLNPERISHVLPYVPGIVRKVPKKLWDRVKKGEVIAVLDSRELSEIQSSFLVARENMTLRKTTFDREEQLWKQKISSEKEYLNAKQAYAEAGIELEVARQKLHSLGFNNQYLEGLSFNNEYPLTYYEIVAPFDGLIIEKHITIGEAVSQDTDIFMIADLSTVCVNLQIYQKNIDYLYIGQPVTISATEQNLSAAGKILYISPLVEKDTRTVTARIELKNPNFMWRPGIFVKGSVTNDIEVEVLIPKSAIFMLENEIVVFVQGEDGLEHRPVTIGKTDGINAEVISGISAGQEYVIEGGFELKAHIVTAGLGSHAGHGH